MEKKYLRLCIRFSFSVLFWILTFSLRCIAQSDGDLDVSTANYWHGQIYQYNSQQSYLTFPFIGDIHLGNNTTHRNYILTADIVPQFFIGGGAFSVAITPEVDLRILRDQSPSPRMGMRVNTWDTSLPVRTPSFIPAATFYIPNRRHFRIKAVQDAAMESNTILPWFLSHRKVHAFRYGYKTISLFHHSNGQDGSNGPQTTSQFERLYNVQNGNFAINAGWEIGYNFGRYEQGLTNKKGTAISPFHNHDHLYGLYFGVKGIFPKSVIPIGDGGELKDRYGFTRLLARAHLIKVTHWKTTVGSSIPDSPYEIFRVVFDISYALDKIDLPDFNWYNRINTEVRCHFGLPRTKFTSFFIAAGYKGQDTYNIYLEDKFAYVRMGLALGVKIHKDMRERKHDNGFRRVPKQIQVNSSAVD